MKKIYLLLSLLSFNAFAQTTVEITDASIEPGSTVNWTKDNVYVCDGLVFVESGSTLNIEAGTVVKFTPRADPENPSALVICRGAKIMAEGTAEEPIIFTSELDMVDDPMDLLYSDVSLWGGLVILGNGITEKGGNLSSAGVSITVEGLPTTEERGQYGGDDNTDNSGILKYVSIRHGGRELQAGNELNGLTLGAVGSGTTLEYIEVYANSDDGVEFFGGAPNLKNCVVAFAEDDSFDWDEVFVGKGQFWFSIQKSELADAAGELDGSTPDDAILVSNPTVYNWTHIGSGKEAAAANANGWLLRAGTAGTIANSIITEQKNKAIEVQDRADVPTDAFSKLVSGDLKIMNNIFWDNGNNTTLDASETGVIKISGGTPREADAATLVAHLATNLNENSDPQLIGISRTPDAMLDPRPTSEGAAYTTPLAAYPAGDDFFTPVSYKGAFSSNGEEFWLEGWTALAQNGHLMENITSVQAESEVANLSIYPNPASASFNVSFESQNNFEVSIINNNGQIVRNTNSDNTGSHNFTVNVSDLTKGFYMVKFTNASNGNFFAKKLVIE